MKINRLHAIIGFLLVVIPLLGFTRGFKYGFSIISGAVILYFAMVSIHNEIRKKQKNRRYDSFIESKPKDPTKSKSKPSTKDIDTNKTPLSTSVPEDSHVAIENIETKININE